MKVFAKLPRQEKKLSVVDGDNFFNTKTFSLLPDQYLDRYNVGDAIVTITHDYKYVVFEPPFKSDADKNSYDQIINYKQKLKEPLETTLDSLMGGVASAASELGLLNVFNDNYRTIQYYVKRDLLGFEIIDVMLNDAKHVEDITCSRYDSVGVIHRDYLEEEVLQSNISFSSLDHMDVFIERLARTGGKHISSSNPIIDMHIADKYRVAIISSELTDSGSPSLSIRLKSEKPFTITDMLDQNLIPVEAIAVIWKMLDFRGTGLVIGGTGAGKTSFLNTLFPLLHKSSKIMTIEDAAELDIPQMDWTPLIISESRSSPKYHSKFQELLDAALRHRPKMVSVGEVRGTSTRNLFDVISTGHSSLSSFHATTTEGAVTRITQEYNVHPASFSHLWFILHMSVVINKNGKHVRKCVEFDEVFFDGKSIQLIALSKYDAQSDTFLGSSLDEMIKKSHKLKDISFFDASSTLYDDLLKRIDLLRECQRRDARSPKQVMEILSRYYAHR